MFGTLALVSTLAGLVAAAPISTESHTTEVFGNFSVSFWYDGAYTGSCGYTNSTKQYIASIRNVNASSDSACGKTINITTLDSSSSVLAMVVDETVDAPQNYLNVSRVTFQQVTALDHEFFNASYTFVDAKVPEWTAPADDNNENEHAPAPAPKKQASSPQASPKAQAPAAPSPKQEQPRPQQQEQEQPRPQPQQQKPTSSSRKVEQPRPTTSSSRKVEQKQKYTPPTTTSSRKQVYTPKTTSSRKEEYTPETTPKKVEKPQETPKKPSSGGGGSFSGRGTWYTQGGNAGACGSVNSDSSYIVAINAPQYAGGSHCGRSVRISANGRTITARVADCSYGALDLSTGAFQALGSLSQGVLSLSWSWA